MDDGLLHDLEVFPVAGIDLGVHMPSTIISLHLAPMLIRQLAIRML